METPKQFISQAEAEAKKVAIGIKETLMYYIFTNWTIYLFSALFIIAILLDLKGNHPEIAIAFILVSVIGFWAVILNSHNKLIRQIFTKIDPKLTIDQPPV